MDALTAALALRQLGWNVIPAPVRAKAPVISWKPYQEESFPERELRRAAGSGPFNLFIVTGAVSRLLVIDCDDRVAPRWWRRSIGQSMEKTTRVRTGSGNYQFYFRLPPGLRVRGRSSDGGESGKWDIRADGGGVIAPPSVHPNGNVYEFVDGHGPEVLQDAPEALIAILTKRELGGGSSRSMLSHLLAHPPAEGGRNNWLAQVAGHYARHFPFEDAYEWHVRDIAARLEPALPDYEVDKLVRSIWESEQAKEGRAAPQLEEGGADDWRAHLLEPAEESGWLVSGDVRILVQTRTRTQEGWEVGLSAWLDADLRVLGVIESEQGRTYDVEVRRPNGYREEDSLAASAVADPRRLGGWLANHGASIGTPDNIWPTKMRDSARLVRYLEAQEAETMEAVPALGWHFESAAFITHEGIIRATGPAPYENVRPDPAVRGWAPYRYGHAGRDGARAVLHEVLGFHDQTVAAVFGSWWAACFLKPQISRLSSQFPFMALEASSESGKSTGFFSLMLQLAGSTAGHTNPTRAALRDSLSAHNNGFVWTDDMDSLEAHGELLRNVTVGGSIIKKAEDHHGQVVAQLRAALVVSGESLGLHGQKALLDRALLLSVPSPTSRGSLKDPDRPQWDDILDLRERHPDLTAFAGSLVELALEQERLVRSLKSLRTGSGRFADKSAVVRLGARILDRVLGGADWITYTADEWVANLEDPGSENALTLRLLPAALARTGWKSAPEGPDQGRRQVATPAFVDQLGDVWFSPQLTAEWWEREPPFSKRLDPRVESAEALKQQARALGLGGRKNEDRRRFRFITGEGGTMYWRCPAELSAKLLARSRGEEEGDGDGHEDRKLFGD